MKAISSAVPHLARILAHATHSIHPSEFTLAPIGAIQKLLEKTGWSADSVDLFEINEAFAMVTMLTMQALNLPHEKVNIMGVLAPKATNRFYRQPPDRHASPRPYSSMISSEVLLHFASAAARLPP